MMYFGNEGMIKYDIMSWINATMEQPLVVMWYTSSKEESQLIAKFKKTKSLMLERNFEAHHASELNLWGCLSFANKCKCRELLENV